MAQQGAGHTRTAAPRPSLFDLIKVVLRLGPKQINDEIQLAVGQMKTKGIAAGIAAGLMVVGLVFVTFLVVALIVAAVAAFGLIFELWAAALIVAGIFLLIAAIFVLVGLLRLKKAMPLMPEDAIRGLRLDLGVAQQGSRFDPRTLDRQDAERRRKKEEAKREAQERKKQEARTAGAGSPKKPPYRELLRRTTQRRDHLGSLHDQIRDRSDKNSLKSEAQGAVAGLREKARTAGRKDQTHEAPAPGASTGSADAQGRAPGDASTSGAGDFVAARWKPLAVLGASAAAGAVFLRELTRR
ncbi:phage holin family protein [Nesterenkonia sp. HG001]|uniref:phage holin family protein n=1 Tax=Nesterenkonia sp. HG001 TaxID=2983207 RepID=UPI002AC77038|nr:phage holin family protein [Nesterenkonia sp. HG001]MDZ5076185.1 phage holin family protein [Nesterenkonia sp. HG001]